MNPAATVLRKKIALCILVAAMVLFLASLFPAGTREVGEEEGATRRFRAKKDAST